MIRVHSAFSLVASCVLLKYTSEMNITGTGRLPEAGNLKLIMRNHLMSIYKSRSKTVKNGPKHF